ncbi:MAG: hypothetical protein JSS49_06480 [Planctomycetes bacterium]|nr:hypothetical protein [Planctomycetota bacterium]
MSKSVLVVATLWEAIKPFERGDRYEDPLDTALAEGDLGHVCGGGSQLSEECGIEFVDIEIELNDLHRGLVVTRATLEAQGAPKGSVLQFAENGEDHSIEFGVTECLAIFLDGVGLPRAVYESTDINVLADAIDDILSAKSLGEIRGSYCGAEETAIFVYGPDAEQLFAGLKPVLEASPLCQNARVVVRYGKAGNLPRVVRLSRT